MTSVPKFQFLAITYLGVPSLFEIGVRSIIPLPVLQTQVASLPGTDGHLVPDGGTGLSFS